MKVQGKDVVRVHELTASVVATKESVSAAINLRTPDPALALAGIAVIGVIAVIAVSAMMLTWGPPRQQSAELDDDDSPQRLEPRA